MGILLAGRKDCVVANRAQRWLVVSRIARTFYGVKGFRGFGRRGAVGFGVLLRESIDGLGSGGRR